MPDREQSPTPIDLPQRWAAELASQPETGMGYQIVSVALTDGRRFEQVLIVEGRITEVRGLARIPFDGADIRELVATHAKWAFDKARSNFRVTFTDAERSDQDG